VTQMAFRNLSNWLNCSKNALRSMSSVTAIWNLPVRPLIKQLLSRLKLAHSMSLWCPGVLLAASHAKNDMPSELLVLQKIIPISIFILARRWTASAVLQVVQERIVAAEAESPHTVRRDDTCLVLVGRGTTDPDANGEVSKFARMIEEGMGFCTASCATPAQPNRWLRMVCVPPRNWAMRG